MESNKEKFKKMNTRQKIEYIWEYYRFIILGTIIGVFVVSQLIYLAVKPKPNFDTHLIVTAQMILDTEKMEEEEALFAEKFNADIYYLPANWSVVDSNTMVNDQILTLKMQTKEADVFAMSQDRYERFVGVTQFDPFLALDEVPEMAPLLEQYKDQLLVGTSVEDNKEHVYGIKVDKVETLNGAQVIEPLVLSIMCVPNNIEKAVELMDFLI